MAAVGHGNFAFVYEQDKELYEHLLFAEKNTRIDYRASGKSIRDALERFIAVAVREKGVEAAVPSGMDLVEKIRTLRFDYQAMQDAGYLKPGQLLKEHWILPPPGEITFIQLDGDTGTRDGYTYLRQLANACSHRPEEVKPIYPEACFDNLVKALEAFHKILLRYYGKRLKGRMPAFNRDTMTIAEYVIEEAYEPSDALRSQCRQEFLGYTLDDEGEPGFYALIRLYRRSELGDAFMLRNHKCFLEACKLCMSGIPEGMTRLRQLTPGRGGESDFYMICYLFNQRPRPLDNGTLQSMNLQQRLEICTRLARCIDDLHQSEVPIYHRMLNYESVYISRFRDKWIPYVIKFDYAKIDSSRPVETVYANAQKVQEILKQQSLSKYLAPEWDVIEKDASPSDWAKVDVYSLGVLMSDILRGSFTGGIADLDELQDMGVPAMVVDALESMLTQSPDARCTMDLVREIFDVEMG